MDLSEARNNTRILEDLMIGDPISQHHGVKCCPAIHESTEERYIVKTLSIPASQVQLDALLLTGAYQTPADALEYFRGRAEEVMQEVDVLKRLHAMEGFLPFTHAEILKSDDGLSYQVHLISPYKRSLERQMQLAPLTHLGAVNLGLDLCAALAICRRAGYLYIDLKPSNVYIIPNQGYRIGDLGFISLSSLKYASFPDQYRSAYTAPEIADALSSLNTRIDIYALGLILYQVYNNGELPAQDGNAFPPPTYADYEMAEIILKACNPDPAGRWADPLQMGQALVAYLQRNSVNDTPIVPPPVEIPPEPEAEDPQTPEAPDSAEESAAEPDVAQADEESSEQELEPESVSDETPDTEEHPVEDLEEDADPLSDITLTEEELDDETLPSEESAAEIAEELVSDEVQEMLTRADELISHELPEPAVAPDPIDVPFPAPIALQEEPADPEAVPSDDADTEEPAQQDEPTEDNADEESEGELTEVVTSEEASSEDDPDFGLANAGFRNTEPDSDDDEDVVEHRVRHRPTRSKKPIIFVACIALLAALIAGGFAFYRYYYLQNVNNLLIDGSVDSLTAMINSSVKDELLTVICTDTYGNTRIQKVTDGVARFGDLNPNTQYRIQLAISGFHRLEGVTSGTYTTAAQTEILNFNAVAGPEDGSVILSFTVNGPEADTWTVAYSTGDETENVLSFAGHSVTVTGLTVGSEYRFRLVPGEDQYLSGISQLNYTAQQIVYAQDLSIKSCSDGVLVAVWTVPEGTAPQNWNVRCYNSHGYDRTITTMEEQAQFTDLDHQHEYTIEVTAVGMTRSSSITVTANPIVLTELKATAQKNHILKLDWAYTGEAPAEGWILDYTIDGSTTITVSCPENTAQITLYPGSQYEIDLRPVGEVTYFGQHLSYQSDPVKKFSGYGVSADNMSFYMCLTPNKKNWDRYDVPRSDYKTSFKVGEKASFLIELWKDRKKSKDSITVTYVIRDKDGVPVSLNSIDSTWNKLWNKKFCELDIPKMPETAGEYTIDIYFNDQKVNKDVLTFSIT